MKMKKKKSITRKKQNSKTGRNNYKRCFKQKICQNFNGQNQRLNNSTKFLYIIISEA